MQPTFWLMMIASVSGAPNGGPAVVHVGNFSELRLCQEAAGVAARVMTGTPSAAAGANFVCVPTNDVRTAPPAEPR